MSLTLTLSRRTGKGMSRASWNLDPHPTPTPVAGKLRIAPGGEEVHRRARSNYQPKEIEPVYWL